MVVRLFISTVGTISQNNISVVRIVCPWFQSACENGSWVASQASCTSDYYDHLCPFKPHKDTLTSTPTFTHNASVEIVRNVRPSLQLEDMIS